MEADHYSKEWDDAPMPHSIFFTKRGHAIHGTDYARRLGDPASHGCVRAVARERGDAVRAGEGARCDEYDGDAQRLSTDRAQPGARPKRAIARNDSGARTPSGDVVVPRAPRQIVPAQPETYESPARPTTTTRWCMASIATAAR